MQGESPSELWMRQRQEAEWYRLRCSVGHTRLQFPDGEIEVRSFGRLCTARIIWKNGYGERSLERGPCTSVFAHIDKILRNGPTFGPDHVVDDDELRFVEFESDESSRATRPHGEVRIKRFLDQYVLLFVPDGGFRLLAVSKDPDELIKSAELYGPEWASCWGPHHAVRFEGRLRELHVSHNASELAYHEVDPYTRLSLRPYSVPDGDQPARVALYRMCARTEKAQLLGFISVDPTDPEPVIWSEEQAARSEAGSGWRSGDRPTEGPASSSASPPGAEPAGSTSMSPGLLALVAQYLGQVADRTDGGKEMLAQSDKLLRAVERGENLSGWGPKLRSAVERACGCKFDGSPRAFNYLVKELKDDGILARPWGRKCQFLFAEFHRPDSPQITLLCQRLGVTPDSVSGTPRGATVDPPPGSPPPTGRTPPTTPPPGAPTPSRDHARTSPPWSPSTPAAPPSSKPAQNGAQQSPPVPPASRRDERASAPTPAQSPSPGLGGNHQVSREPPSAPREDEQPRAPAPTRSSMPPTPGKLPAPPVLSPLTPAPSGVSPGPPVGTNTASEDPFAAFNKLLSIDSLRVGASPPVIPPSAPLAVSGPRVAPTAPPAPEFMEDEFLFLDRGILRSAAEPTDEDLEDDDPDGFPRGPPDEE